MSRSPASKLYTPGPRVEGIYSLPQLVGWATLDVCSCSLCRGLIDPRITASITRMVLGRLVKFFSVIMLFLCFAYLLHYVNWLDSKRSANTKEGIH